MYMRSIRDKIRMISSHYTRAWSQTWQQLGNGARLDIRFFFAQPNCISTTHELNENVHAGLIVISFGQGIGGISHTADIKTPIPHVLVPVWIIGLAEASRRRRSKHGAARGMEPCVAISRSANGCRAVYGAPHSILRRERELNRELESQRRLRAANSAVTLFVSLVYHQKTSSAQRPGACICRRVFLRPGRDDRRWIRIQNEMSAITVQLFLGSPLLADSYTHKHLSDGTHPATTPIRIQYAAFSGLCACAYRVHMRVSLIELFTFSLFPSISTAPASGFMGPADQANCLYSHADSRALGIPPQYQYHQASYPQHTAHTPYYFLWNHVERYSSLDTLVTNPRLMNSVTSRQVHAKHSPFYFYSFFIMHASRNFIRTIARPPPFDSQRKILSAQFRMRQGLGFLFTILSAQEASDLVIEPTINSTCPQATFHIGTLMRPITPHDHCRPTRDAFTRLLESFPLLNKVYLAILATFRLSEVHISTCTLAVDVENVRREFPNGAIPIWKVACGHVLLIVSPLGGASRTHQRAGIRSSGINREASSTTFKPFDGRNLSALAMEKFSKKSKRTRFEYHTVNLDFERAALKYVVSDIACEREFHEGGENGVAAEDLIHQDEPGTRDTT
ncbi:hypothetical protein B0H13DRAFT_1906531 [Mycena leptocephala]|nr:hypothetical protein B0H13DRAFT_1906531 [Mycena leptocephala]